MAEDTNSMKDLRGSDGASSYDMNAKMLIGNPIFLAPLLKYAIRELNDVPVEEINAGLGEKYISCVSVETGRMKESMTKLDATTYINNEGYQFFDVLTTLALPNSKERALAYVYIDAEIQNRLKPGYDPVKRAIFYCSRMISSQYGKEITSKNYDGLRKVYSIWICFGCDKNSKNTVSRYKIAKEDVFGVYDNDDYDYLEIIMARVPDSASELNGNYPLIELAGTLLSNGLDAETKKRVLQNKFNIRLEKESEGRIDDMCNLSEGIIEKERENGMRIMAETYKEIGKSSDDCVRILVDKYGIGEDRAQKTVKRYWE